MTHESKIGESRGELGVTRRKIVALSAIAAVPIVTPTIATVPSNPPLARAEQIDEGAGESPHPDAELLALAEQYIAAEKRSGELHLIADRLEAPRKRGAAPDVLTWRVGDEDLSDNDAIKKKGWTWRYAIDGLRGKENISRFSVREVDGKTSMASWKEPLSPQARARADEIVAAYDKWTGGKQHARGYRKAVRERNRAAREAERLLFEITSLPAQTTAGMHAKVRCILAYSFAESIEKMNELPEDLAISIFQDIEEMAATA
jgi:hypothetical protein